MTSSSSITTQWVQASLPPGNWPEQGAWTLADWEGLPADGNRYELIDGVLYVTSAPSPLHQWASDTLVYLLRTHFVAQTPPSGVLFSATGVILPTGPVIPDIVYIHMHNLHIVSDKRIVGVPDIMVEIASPGTAAYDRREKQDAYAQSGVPEYWWVDPGSRTVEVLVLQNLGVYRPVALVEGQAAIPSVQIPNLSFPVDSIFMPLDLRSTLPRS